LREGLVAEARTQLPHSYQAFRSRGRSRGTQPPEYRIAHSVESTAVEIEMLESDGQVHASSFRSVAASCTRFEPQTRSPMAGRAYWRHQLLAKSAIAASPGRLVAVGRRAGDAADRTIAA